MTYVVIVAFLAILGSLGAALYFMLRGGGPDASSQEPQARKGSMARALAVRVGFSILLFVVVLVGYFMGWIQPTGLPLQR